MISAVFLDRDGVINRHRDDYVKSWDEFEFLPRSLPALRQLAAMSCRIVIVTNQSAIGRGIVQREAVEEINRRMVEAVEAHGGRIDAVLYCPHRPDEYCACRKPKPGLLYRASKELKIDLSTAILVGDHVSDVEAAERAGCQMSVLVLSGRHSLVENVPSKGRDARVHVASDLFDAIELISSMLVISP